MTTSPARYSAIEPLLLDEVRLLLKDLENFYPDFVNWLSKTVAEVEAGNADSVQYRFDNRLVGIAFGVSKPGKGYKVRTLYVEPNFRGNGIGRHLLKSLLALPGASGQRVYITVAEANTAPLAPLLHEMGFKHKNTVGNPHRLQQHELIFVRA